MSWCGVAWWRGAGVYWIQANPHSKETGNRAFVDDLTKWIFQETGVVRVVSTTHHREGETEPRDQYRKKDNVVGIFGQDDDVGYYGC